MARPSPLCGAQQRWEQEGLWTLWSRLRRKGPFLGMWPRAGVGVVVYWALAG